VTRLGNKKAAVDAGNLRYDPASNILVGGLNYGELNSTPARF